MECDGICGIDLIMCAVTIMFYIYCRIGIIDTGAYLATIIVLTCIFVGAYKCMVNTRAAMEVCNTVSSCLTAITTKFHLALA